MVSANKYSQIYYTFVIQKKIKSERYGTTTDHLQHFR